MAGSAELLRLAERAEAGGDASLNEEVHIALGWSRDLLVSTTGWLTPPGPTGWRRVEHQPLPDLCTSIDAQEAALPGRIGRVRRIDDENWFAWCVDDVPEVRISARTEPLARLAARLRAMAAQKENADGQ